MITCSMACRISIGKTSAPGVLRDLSNLFAARSVKHRPCVDGQPHHRVQKERRAQSSKYLQHGFFLLTTPRNFPCHRTNGYLLKRNPLSQNLHYILRYYPSTEYDMCSLDVARPSSCLFSPALLVTIPTFLCLYRHGTHVSD